MRHTSIALLFTLIFILQGIAQVTQNIPELFLESSPYEVEIYNESNINSQNLEFSPVFYQNGVVYTSSKINSGFRDKKIDETFFELYYAETDPNFHLLKPKSFSAQINSQLHEGPVTFNKEGTEMYFTRNNSKNGVRKADRKGVVRLKIYMAKRGLFDWENIEELPFNNDGYSCAHPSLAENGQRLFFASDMPGGYGGMDLYMVERNESGWGRPRNLGPAINTRKNEVFPFIHSSGTLFFASNGHETIGGLDICMADLLDEEPFTIRLQAPINSEQDDLGFILNQDGSRGFFSSSRSNGFGKDDIYSFNLRKIYTNAAMAGKSFESSIFLFNMATGEPIPEASIRIFEKTESGYLGGPGELYNTMLMPVEENTGEMVFKLIRKEADELGDPDVFTDKAGNAPITFQTEKQYLILVMKDGYESKELILSTFGKFRESQIELALEPKRCTNIIGVVKSTDNQQALANTLITIKSSCWEEDEVIMADENGAFQFCLPTGCDYIFVGTKEGFTRGSLDVFASMVDEGIPLLKELFLEPDQTALKSPSYIIEGTVIVLENIYYDFNKSAIRKGDARELDELAAILNKYPSMEIELISHTDSRGDRRYNKKLSLERSESSKLYLVARGVDPRRIKTIGMGESQIRNHCKDGVTCNEEEHLYNRRTEVRVTKVEQDIDIRYNDGNPGSVN